MLEKLRAEQPELLRREELQELTGRTVTDSGSRFGAFVMAANTPEELLPWLPAEPETERTESGK